MNVSMHERKIKKDLSFYSNIWDRGKDCKKKKRERDTHFKFPWHDIKITFVYEAFISQKHPQFYK